MPRPTIQYDPTCNWKRYAIYDSHVDLTQSIDWFLSDIPGNHWPISHYATIDYRPGNPHGDVRINWELNRLQFLPAMVAKNEDLARKIIIDWLDKNRFMHGPAYIASMEVALRWISIYRAVCLFKKPLETPLRQKLSGLAVASGKFIERRLSTHSSTGNHLIVESVGLFWIAKGLEGSRLGRRWIEKARTIVWKEIVNQIHPDGSSKEQSFWYLGFVLDAILNYYLLEKRQAIPEEVWARVGRALSFIKELTLPDGSYPDFGDRDDGYVFRPISHYANSFFPRLIQTGAFFYEDINRECDQLSVFKESDSHEDGFEEKHPHTDFIGDTSTCSHEPLMKTYPDGGMTLIKWGRGRLLFRHSNLGLESLFGHGHADALSVLFWWDNIPVLIDLGSGQYNGDQGVRDYFRSTLAHNTVEINGKNQATIMGPFMWGKSYQTTLHEALIAPCCRLSASHDGYADSCSTIHKRDIEWPDHRHLKITDNFSGPGGIRFRVAFHLGSCKTVNLEKQTLEAEFESFSFFIDFPNEFNIDVLYGSDKPFGGWHSTVYGKWNPNYSIVYSGMLRMDHSHTVQIKIDPK